MSGVNHSITGANQTYPVDTYFDNTTLLLSASETTGSQNNTFIDSSNNNFTITRNGTVTQGNFNPFHSDGYWSAYFDGSGDYLTLPSNSLLAPGTYPGDFTIEAWVFPNSLSTYNIIYISNVVDGLLFGKITNGYGLRRNGNVDLIAATAPATNQWVHLAATRNGTQTRMFINGELKAQLFNTTDWKTASVTVGADNAGGNPWVGYISNLRFVKGVALYVNNFIPPAGPNQVVASTQLLCLQSNYFVDKSSNNFAITVSGNTKVSNFNPFSSNISNLRNGFISNYFDGSGDRLEIISGNQSAFSFGSVNFTIEAWIYPETTSSERGIVNNWQGGGAWIFNLTASNTLNFTYTNTPSGISTINYTGTTTVSPNVWTHVAIVRNGATLQFYINGAADATSHNIGTSVIYFYNSEIKTLRIGVSGDLGNHFTGYITNLRIVSGTAVYTAAFSPSLGPLTALSGTLLLTCQSSRFIDNSGLNYGFQVVGNTNTSSVSPFTPSYIDQPYTGGIKGHSAYFDGSGDYLSLPASAAFGLGTGDFTMEAWIFISTAPGTVFDNRTGTTSMHPVFYVQNTGQLTYYVAGTGRIVSTALLTNIWYHVALCRSSESTRMFVNGVQVGSTYADSNNFSTSGTVLIGGGFNSSNMLTGYLSNVRIIKGTAVYTSNFSVPSTRLENVANTQLLLYFDNASIQDRTSGNNIITVGDAQTSYVQGNFGAASVYFDGTGDWLTIPANSNLSFGTGDFTIELWMYVPDYTTRGAIISNRSAASSSTDFKLQHFNSNLYFGTTSTDLIVGSTTLTANIWYYVVVQRQGTELNLYLNSVADAISVTNSTNFSDISIIGIGVEPYNNTYPFTGYIQNLRVTKGVARYFANPTVTIPSTAVSFVANTTLLLQTSGTDGGQNNTFIDSSANNLTVTRNGNPTQGNFSPYIPAGYWSNYFDGSGDYIAQSENINNKLSLGTGIFTIECFIFPTANPANGPGTLFDFRATDSATAFYVLINNSRQVVLYDGPANTNRIFTLRTINLDAWNHVALVRDASTNITCYVNGISAGTVVTASDFTFANQPVRIGASLTAGYDYNGYISNLRLVRLTAVYTGDFTVPTTPLTATGETNLLACDSNRFYSFPNYSLMAIRLDITGTPKVTAFNPFATVNNASADSVYLDGSGDYFSFASNSLFTIGTANFTIEFWAYPLTNSNTICFFNVGNSQLFLEWNPSGGWKFGAAGVSGTSMGGIFPLNAWSHIAVVRISSVVYLWVNGYIQGIAGYSSSTSWSQAGLWVGALFDGGQTFHGYLSNYRFINGTAAYSTTLYPALNPNILVPTAPVTAVTDTRILLNFVNTNISDITNINNMETVGNAQVSTGTRVFSPGSISFDGTGDRLVFRNTVDYDLNTGSFSIDFWIRLNAVGAAYAIISTYNNATTDYWEVQITASNFVSLVVDNTAIFTGNVALSVNTWYYVSIFRENKNLFCYVNNLLAANLISSADIDSTRTTISVGATVDGIRQLNGYIQDLRIVKGRSVFNAASNISNPVKLFPVN